MSLNSIMYMNNLHKVSEGDILIIISYIFINIPALILFDCNLDKLGNILIIFNLGLILLI
jgi:hypothetical protein